MCMLYGMAIAGDNSLLCKCWPDWIMEVVHMGSTVHWEGAGEGLGSVGRVNVLPTLIG